MRAFSTMANKAILLSRGLLLYWKTIFMIAYPLALMPLLLWMNTPPVRCLYVICLMSGYWVFEIFPLAVTALIPMALFPVMGILDSQETSMCYMKETNMMFVGGLIIAIAVEHCNLHTRISLYIMSFIGCSPRRLSFGLCTVTMLVSMWISNTAATAMMIPIVDATLKELNDQGIGKMYEDPVEGERDEDRRPTKHTMCMYISIAYAAGLGGLGSLIGSGTNLTFKGIYEGDFPKSPEGVDFTKWMLFNVPLMLVSMGLSWIWMQYYFMGLFRPKSPDAQAIELGLEGNLVTKRVINDKIEELGKWSFHEICVALCFVLAVLLWFFRQPQFIPGWADLIPGTKVKDATPAIIVVLLMFMVPCDPQFLHILSDDEEKRPKKPSASLITWQVINKKMSWGLIFLLGGGFAIAKASHESGMSAMIAESMRGVTEWPPYAILAASTVFATFLTQFSSNVAVANILLPVLAEMSRAGKIHPLYMMLPAAIGCSLAFCLPVSTPPNGIAAAPINMPTVEMVKVGSGVMLIGLVSLLIIFPVYAPLVYPDLGTFPEWAA